jgi:Trk-type K+ transport system membrane component
MTLPRLAISLFICVSLVLATALLFRYSLEQAILLAPVIVVVVGAIGFLIVLWTRIAVSSLKEARHPRRVLALGLAGLALLIVLSFFVDLPAHRY